MERCPAWFVNFGAPSCEDGACGYDFVCSDIADGMLCRTMPDLRKSVLDELERRQWSHYQLVQALKGKRAGGKDVPAPTVYEFLRGDTAINSNDLGLIFDALSLKVARK